MTTHTLLTCIDDSAYTGSVLDHASWAATRLQANVEIMHAIERHTEQAPTADLSGSIGVDAEQSLLAELAALDEKRGKLALDRGHQLLDAAVMQVEDQAVATVHPRLRHGELLDILEAENVEHDLLVLGKRGASADFAKLHLGGTMERMLRTSTRPVLVASRAFRPVHKVLVAFDGSATARKAVEMVARSPLFSGVECHLVMAAAENPTSSGHMQWAEALLDAAGVALHIEMIPGNADEVITNYVTDQAIDLLVLGAYGHSRVRELLVGNTTTSLIRHCLVPALVVR